MASPTQIGISTYQADSAQPSVTRFIGFLVAAGLINASIAAYLLCPLPSSHHPSLTGLVVRATLYVAGAALAGTAGAWFYWTRPSNPFRANPPISFRLFALTNAAAWVWLPAFVLLSGQDSPASACIAVLAAMLLATGLRKAIRPTSLQQLQIPGSDEKQLFAETLRTPPREIHGYIIAICIYFAAFELHSSSNLDASALFAFCAFLIAWKLTLAPQSAPSGSSAITRRLGFVIPAAILVTLFALLFGVAIRNLTDAAAASARSQAQDADAHKQSQPADHAPASGISGYQSIILWPVPPKKQIVPPIPVQTSFLAPGTKPLIIKFDGPYWYYQPPNKRPSPTAYKVLGTPLVHDFQTNNFVSLIMDAHQTLGTSIPLARCREIQVDILNRDNRAGAINLVVLLSDSSSPSKQLYLGRQPVVSSLPGTFTIKSAPVSETLRFPIPTPASIRRFDEITVMFFPDSANYDQGAKVAIDQFQLIPR